MAIRPYLRPTKQTVRHFRRGALLSVTFLGASKKACYIKGREAIVKERLYSFLDKQAGKTSLRERSIAMRNISTEKVKRLNEKTLLVTVDMGMVRHSGYCRCPSGTEVKPFDFSNSRKGFEEFWACVWQTKKINNLEEVVIGFESTGPYAEPLLHFLRKKGTKLVQVNPLHTKRLKELQGNSPGKTDHKDPKVIADIIELGHALTVIIPEGIPAELRRLTAARERSVQRRTALLNQLQSLIFIIFPEFLQVLKNTGSKTSQYLLKHWPTPEDIISKGKDDLARTLKTVSRGNMGREQAEALYMAAKESVGIKEGRKSIILEIIETISAIESTDRFVAIVEAEMGRCLSEIPYSLSILSIKGIGPITAAGLIGEVGDFRQFGTISEIMKHAGLDLYEVSSGKHKGKKRISKRGRHLLRKLLFFAAMNTVRKGGVMHEYYQSCLQRGMLRIKAIIAVARKLLRIIFAVVRDLSEFASNYMELQYRLNKAA
jgi:transposase